MDIYTLSKESLFNSIFGNKPVLSRGGMMY